MKHEDLKTGVRVVVLNDRYGQPLDAGGSQEALWTYQKGVCGTVVEWDTYDGACVVDVYVDGQYTYNGKAVTTGLYLARLELEDECLSSLCRGARGL